MNRVDNRDKYSSSGIFSPGFVLPVYTSIGPRAFCRNAPLLACSSIFAPELTHASRQRQLRGVISGACAALAVSV